MSKMNAGRTWAWGCRIVMGLMCAVMAVSGGWLAAATKAEKTKAAEQLVKEALHREIYGLAGERGQLLDEALKQLPEFEPAMWHRGFVRYQNKWIKAEDLPAAAGQDPRLVAYLKIRGDYADTAEGQLSLADWCAKRGLAEQERAHLTRVVSINADHAEARRRLGFRRVNGDWMTDADIAQVNAQRADDRKNLEAWRPKIEIVLQQLQQTSELRRKTAEAKILEIRDVTAIPALEQLLVNQSEDTAQLVVETLGNMPVHEASEALARIAALSQWEKVRLAAAMKLKARPQDDYVPTLLSAMYTPLVTRSGLSRTSDGRLLYRHAFMREGQQQREQLVLDTAFQRVAQPGGDGAETLAQTIASADNAARFRELSAQEQNLRTKQLNERIATVLGIATSQSLSADPQSWWQWWNDRNEVFIEGPKQTKTVHQTEQVAVSDRVTLATAAGISSMQLPKDCLAAGTPVWTSTGPVAIEKIQVGDLVLSQNPDTGELSYKPVLQTTVRPKGRLVKINAVCDVIETSGGHLFWVSGDGWVRARYLKSGMELHGVNGPVRVSLVEVGGDEETYNLIVADFNSYFVGESKILSHDNTVRQPTSAVVPGLIDR
jgi:hypothetical protein